MRSYLPCFLLSSILMISQDSEGGSREASVDLDLIVAQIVTLVILPDRDRKKYHTSRTMCGLLVSN